MRSFHLLIVTLLSALVVLGCSRGCSSEALAVLVELNGTVERDHAASVGQWGAASQGAEFFVGDLAVAGTETLVQGSRDQDVDLAVVATDVGGSTTFGTSRSAFFAKCSASASPCTTPAIQIWLTILAICPWPAGPISVIAFA